MITQEHLKKRLRYCHKTGLFTWLHAGMDLFKNRRSFLRWNSRYQGTKAGSQDKDGYVIINLDGTTMRSARLAWLYVYGSFPKNQIDHIDGSKSNDAINNLRDVTQKENSRNLATPKSNRSGHIGVSLINKTQTWEALIRVNYKRIYLGRYKTKKEAIAARLKAEKKYRFHKNHGRSS